ncbi:MAG: alpha/beta fold hydrolase [Solirubrobacterales bacterium]
MNQPTSVGRASRSGVELHFEVYGEGAPIVMVAGLGDDHLSWQPQVEELADDHQVVVFDNRGIGKSTIAPGPYDVREMAEDCHAVVEVLGLTGVTAVGSSMGGAICQLWALEHPDDVGRLVLTNTWGRREPFLEALFSHWIRLGEEGDDQGIMESLLLFCFSPEYLMSNPGAVQEFYEAERPNLEGFIAGSHACRSHDSLERLAAIAQPTLVIAGEYDILTRPECSHEIVARIPKAELATLSTGHMVFWERAAEFNALIRRFVQ